MIHLVKGHYNQNLRADIVTQMIKEIKNGDQIRDMIQNTDHCQPVTVGIMAKLLGVDPQRKDGSPPQ